MLAQSTKVGVGEEGKYAYQRPARVRRCGGSAPGVRPRGDAVESGRGMDGLGDGSAGARGRGAGARGRRRVWSPGRWTAQGRGTGLGDGAGAVDGAGDWARRVWSGD